MKKLIIASALIASSALTGCMSNAADNAVPAPTDLDGVYKAGFFGGSVTWVIEKDGTGYACEQRTDMNQDTKIRDIVINGTKAYDVFEFDLIKITDKGFTAEGISDLEFKKLNKIPATCRI